MDCIFDILGPDIRIFNFPMPFSTMKNLISCFRLVSFSFLVVLLFQCTSDRSVNEDLVGISGLNLPDDLEATLWATSPAFYNPTNIDVDARGRIWVTEAVDYRLFNNEPEVEHGHGDRIVILEDQDGDGVAETSRVFVQDEDLVAPLGIAVFGNKVYVSCSPNLLIYTDEDGDDVPDKKEVFLTGFGGFDHDHSLHAVLAGPGGRLYFNTGNAGPHVVTDQGGWTLRSGSMYNGGSPYNKSNMPGLISDDGRQWTGGLALRINPDGTGLKVMAHNFRNSYEITVDSYGNMWQNDNDDDGNRGTRVTWLMEGANQGYFSEDGSRSWRADRRPGQGTAYAHWHQGDPGVMPMGDSTGAGSPTGIVLNESDAMGEFYRGMLLSCEAGRNVILAYQPEKQGGGYQMNRINLITSLPEDEVEEAESRYTGDDKNKWFRPSDIAVGTDGAWYIADWYDPVVGGHRARDTMALGRIYRITPRGRNLSRPEIDLSTTEGQIEALLNPAINVRHQGFVKLIEQGPEVIPQILALLNRNNPYHQARAVWLLAQLGPKGVREVESLLSHPNPDIRLTAYRALRETQEQFLDFARKLSRDPDAGVRREVAVSLRDIPWQSMQEIGLTLAEHYTAGDRASLEALGLAFDGKETEAYEAINQKMGGQPLRWTDEMADLAWRLHPVSAVNALKTRAAAAQLSVLQREQAIVALGFINDQRAVDAMESLRSSALSDVQEQATWWLAYRHSNDWNEYEMDLPAEVINERAEMHDELMALRKRVLSDTAAMDSRIRAGRRMARSSAGGEILVGLASEGQLPDELKSALAGSMESNPDQSVRAIAAEYFVVEREDNALDIDRLLALKGNREKGEAVFKSYCSSCHTVDRIGRDIGPELTKIHQKYGKSGLIDAIIHPSAGMSFGYESWLITRKDGSTVFGFLQGDGNVVTLKDMSGKIISIPANDIESRKQFATSIMPEPSSLGLTDQDIADVSAFLLRM